MQPPDFWRELASQFMLIPGCGMLRFDGTYVIGSRVPWAWQPAGGGTDFTRDTFDTLARRAAFHIAPAGTSDLLVAWLEAIRGEHINFRISQHLPAVEIRADGSEGLQYMTGSISSPCEASAILCRKLEAEAIQKDFEEKTKNDPRNWSPFRAQYEAFKAIKEARKQPPERIPEEFIINTIAEMHHIKPSEVSRKQIEFEVSGLLSAYPHIEVIRSTPQPESKDVLLAATTATLSSAPTALEETIGAQLQRLRKECNLSVEKLAEAARFTVRTVARHLSDETIPHLSNIARYEQIFGKRLKRKVVIKKLP